MEDSPHAAKVLQDLVDQKYVRRFRNIDDAKVYLKCKEPILSKMALVTVEKDGVLKHRLVMDCRVSWTSSSTTKKRKAGSPSLE